MIGGTARGVGLETKGGGITGFGIETGIGGITGLGIAGCGCAIGRFDGTDEFGTDMLGADGGTGFGVKGGFGMLTAGGFTGEAAL